MTRRRFAGTGALDMFSYHGQVYGIPRAGHFGCHVIYVNQVLARRATTGKRGTMFGGGALSLSKQTKLAVEGWEWVKWITNKENGVAQVAGGAGSPGARDDVWGDPRLAQISPIYGLIQRTYRTPGPTHLPWNETYFELLALINPTLNKLWDGKTGLRDTVQTIAAEAAPILQKAPA